MRFRSCLITFCKCQLPWMEFSMWAVNRNRRFPFLCYLYLAPHPFLAEVFNSHPTTTSDNTVELTHKLYSPYSPLNLSNPTPQLPCTHHPVQWNKLLQICPEHPISQHLKECMKHTTQILVQWMNKWINILKVKAIHWDWDRDNGSLLWKRFFSFREGEWRSRKEKGSRKRKSQAAS